MSRRRSDSSAESAPGQEKRQKAELDEGSELERLRAENRELREQLDALLEPIASTRHNNTDQLLLCATVRQLRAKRLRRRWIAVRRKSMTSALLGAPGNSVRYKRYSAHARARARVQHSP